LGGGFGGGEGGEGGVEVGGWGEGWGEEGVEERVGEVDGGGGGGHDGIWMDEEVYWIFEQILLLIEDRPTISVKLQEDRPLGYPGFRQLGAERRLMGGSFSPLGGKGATALGMWNLCELIVFRCYHILCSRCFRER
jgi:hypothetical protein